jgi:hypothetical protein
MKAINTPTGDSIQLMEIKRLYSLSLEAYFTITEAIATQKATQRPYAQLLVEKAKAIEETKRIDTFRNQFLNINQQPNGI